MDLTKWPYEIPQEDIVVNLEILGEPISKARARMGKYGNFYTPQKTRGYENFLSTHIKIALGSKEPDAVSFFGVRAIFYRSTRHRIDCDNLMKSVFDAGNKLVYEDDRQISEEFAKLFLADKNPRVVFVIYKVKDTTPKRICLFCKKEFVRPPAYKANFCSMACRNLSKRETKSCQLCKRDFNLPMSIASHATYCSRKCTLKAIGISRTMLKGPGTWKCTKCGGYVTRKEYTRCMSCFVKSRQEATSNYYLSRKIINGKGMDDKQVNHLAFYRREKDGKDRTEVKVETL